MAGGSGLAAPFPAPPMTAPLPAHEAARLAALRETGLLDTLPEPAYDDVVQLARQICRTPIALISLVDGERQWFKARTGLKMLETPRSQSFCAHAILAPDELLEVPDATADPRFADNPLVTGAPHLRFYAGVPLRAPENGLPLGSLCVLDDRPRELDANQRAALHALGRQVGVQLELQRALAARARAERSWRETERRFTTFMDHSPAMAFIKDAEGRMLYVNAPLLCRFGKRSEEMLGKSDFELWPPDVAAVLRASDRRVLAGGTAVALEEVVPTPDGGSTHWLSYKFPLDDGAGGQLLAGMAVDITARKLAEQERERLVGELRAALAKVKTLEGFLPICAACKNIRDDAGYWHGIEAYLRDHAEVEFTHSICPDCREKLYPGLVPLPGIPRPAP